MIEHDLSFDCPVSRCEGGRIFLEPLEAKALGCHSMIIKCKECNGLGKLEELELEIK